MSEATPRPWRMVGDCIVQAGLSFQDAKPIVMVAWPGGDFCDNHEANAAHIVQCANRHDALVAACEAALRDTGQRPTNGSLAAMLRSALDQPVEVAG